MTSELFNEASKLLNSVSYDCDTHYAKTIYVHTSKLIKGFLSRAKNLSLKIKRLEITHFPLDLAKPL
jgi:hypothetical protein